MPGSSPSESEGGRRRRRISHPRKPMTHASAMQAPMTIAHLDDFIVWIALGIVLGGRIGYVLFYDMQAVSENPMRAFEIWNGGMSFHGGLIGSIIAMILLFTSGW